jgi:hypothetical protein
LRGGIYEDKYNELEEIYEQEYLRGMNIVKEA